MLSMSENYINAKNINTDLLKQLKPKTILHANDNIGGCEAPKFEQG